MRAVSKGGGVAEEHRGEKTLRSPDDGREAGQTWSAKKNKTNPQNKTQKNIKRQAK